jgi:uncharacterized membrane protein YjdF
MSIANYFRLSVDRQRQLTRGMQLILFGFVFVGLERQSPTIVLNALLGFSITFLPAILERDHEIPMNPAITLWITAAVFLHAIGIIGVPGTGIAFYSAVPFYDHITHAFSASVVAGVGYATVRAFDQHSDGISLPPRVTFVFILVFVLAFGVIWELIEFGVDVLTTRAGVEMSGFTQHGLNDTMLDLVFNTLGGIVIAIWGTVYLTDIADAIEKRIERREAEIEE